MGMSLMACPAASRQPHASCKHNVSAETYCIQVKLTGDRYDLDKMSKQSDMCVMISATLSPYYDHNHFTFIAQLKGAATRPVTLRWRVRAWRNFTHHLSVDIPTHSPPTPTLHNT